MDFDDFDGSPTFAFTQVEDSDEREILHAKGKQVRHKIKRKHAKCCECEFLPPTAFLEWRDKWFGTNTPAERQVLITCLIYKRTPKKTKFQLNHCRVSYVIM